SIDNAVVREQPVVLEKRVSVAHFQGGTGRVTDMCDEGRPGQLASFYRELAVLPSGHRWLVEHGLTVGLERPEAGAVGIAFALLDEVVGRREQPEGCGHHPFIGMQPEQPAHGPMLTWPRRERNG